MTDATGVLPPSLQPWRSRPSASQKSFASVLGRIFHERGHFRDISEAGLRDEIQTQAISAPTPPEEDGIDADTPSAAAAVYNAATKDEAKSRGEQLQTARRNVLEHIASAQNEALLALDFVSLVLSKDIRGAEATMSPLLKQSVPTGTLGIDMWAGMQTDPQVERTDALLARGQRMQALGNSANALIQAAERLESTVQKEKRYWDGVLKLKDEGWAVCRMPRERGALGVRYGFGEAHGEFKARGLAALRMDAKGDVVLDRHLGHGTRALCVRIKDGDRLVAQSRVRDPQSDGSDICGRIKAARDTLFEEELWHEAMKEARNLGAYDVRVHGTTISMPLDDHSTVHCARRVEVDLIPLDDHTDTILYDPLSNSLAVALRLLLSNLHRQRLDRRSRIPAPLSATSSKQDRPSAQIIRPLLALLHHHVAARALDASLKELVSVLSRAGIAASLTATDSLTTLLDATASVGELLFGLSSPQTWTATLKMQARGGSTEVQEFGVSTTSGFEPPWYGTNFRSHSAARPEWERATPSLDEMMGHVGYVARGLLTQSCREAYSAAGWSVDWRLGRITRTVTVDAKSDRRGNVQVDLARDETGFEGWNLRVDAGGRSTAWDAGSDENEKGFWEVVGQGGQA